MTPSRIRSRAGMTLVEVVVALLIGLIVLQVAVGFFAQQGQAFSRGTTSMNALQNSRYAVNALEKDVRTLGTNVPEGQPALVYAGPDVVAFNADYASSDANDLFAVYYERGAPASQTQAATTTSRFLIPMSAFSYPDTMYRQGGVNSPAETVTFFFQPDATTTRGDDYALYRQVNAGTAAVVARSILKTGNQNFFEYLSIQVPANAPTRLASVGSGPFAHRAAMHGSQADTGSLARVDSIRAVRVRFTVTSADADGRQRTRSIERTIRMPNAGLATRNVCGDRPQGPAVTAQRVDLGGGQVAVQVSWPRSVDETGGEQDVLRYVLWKRTALDPAFGDPFVSIPAGLVAYSYVDQSVTPGLGVQYALAAQDCTPSSSSQTVTGMVIP
jgi:type II secretory pathway pseudopilin PulG